MQIVAADHYYFKLEVRLLQLLLTEERNLRAFLDEIEEVEIEILEEQPPGGLGRADRHDRRPDAARLRHPVALHAARPPAALTARTAAADRPLPAGLHRTQRPTRASSAAIRTRAGRYA